jgi:threonine synthase
MGLPVNKLICASNENKVLTDFFQTGIYDRNREFKQTNSPSMDILVSSNLERFLFEQTNHNADKIKQWMNDLNTKGKFIIDKETKSSIDQILVSGFATQEETLETIKKVYQSKNYTLDTHTAVAVKVYYEYLRETKDKTKTVIDATASPFKFNSSVLEAIKGAEAVDNKDEFAILEELSEVSGLPIHHGLKDLDKKPVIHKIFCTKEGIKKEIMKILGI